MLPMKRNQKTYWVRHYSETVNSIAIYTDHERVYINLFPTNADSDLIALGAEYKEYMRAKITAAQGSLYGVGDLFYDSEPVYKDESDIGNAIYRTTSIMTTLNVSEIMCKRLSGAE